MPATVEEPAARGARLEEDVARIRDLRLDIGPQAQACGLSLVHSDTHALPSDMANVKQMLGEPSLA